LQFRPEDRHHWGDVELQRAGCADGVGGGAVINGLRPIHGRGPWLSTQTGESVVLVSGAPANLAFAPRLSEPIPVRSTYTGRAPADRSLPAGAGLPAGRVGTNPKDTDSRIPDLRHQQCFTARRTFAMTSSPGMQPGFFIYVDMPIGQVEASAGERRVGRGAFAEDPAETESRREGAHRGVWGQHHGGRRCRRKPGLIFWERWRRHCA